MTQTKTKTSIEYIIVAVPFHADAATHDELARKVNKSTCAKLAALGLNISEPVKLRNKSPR